MERRIRTRIVQLAEDPFDPRLSAPLTERAGVRKSRVGADPQCKLTRVVHLQGFGRESPLSKVAQLG